MCCNFLYEAANYMANVGAITGGLHKDQDTCQPDIFKECNHHEKGMLNYQWQIF